jgi:hypothetical protein
MELAHARGSGVFCWIAQSIFWRMQMKAEYRIVRDRYAGYEVHVRRWWHWPIWWQIYGVNTSPTMEIAETLAKNHAAGSHSGGDVTYLGRL